MIAGSRTRDLHGILNGVDPSGLTQLYGHRYGTAPIVRRVGGLADTVDATVGFVFLEPESTLTAALQQAIDVFRKPALWQARMREGMRRDHGWSSAASHYITLYQTLLQAAASPS